MNPDLPDDAKVPDRAVDAWLWLPPEAGARMLVRTSTVLVLMLSLNFQMLFGADALHAPINLTELKVAPRTAYKLNEASAHVLQDRRVTGKVTSEEEGQPLPGVSVILKGTQSGAVTDAEGNYVISVSDESAVLVFSFIGYKTVEVQVEGRTSIDVSLGVDVTQLTEVVVTSFGIEQEKQSLGFSVQELDGDEIVQMHQPNVVSSLQGQVAGVQITNSGGAPGMSSRILIRGITSLNPDADNQPLFIVDGIPIDNNTFETAEGSSENTPRGLSNPRHRYQSKRY